MSRKEKQRVPVAEVVATHRIPLAEVSGLALRRRGDGSVRLMAVGDTSAELAVAGVDDAGDPSDWALLDLDHLIGGGIHLEQLEAVAADGTRHVVVMGEEPSRVALGDAEERRFIASWSLDPTPIRELDKAWRKDENSRGEGLLLMRQGHLLVAKEKRPAGLVEFGPEGDVPLGVSEKSLLGPGEEFEPRTDVDRLVALAWWPYAGEEMGDVSDLAIDAGGSVRLLSDQSRCIGRLTGPLAPGAGGFTVDDVVALPAGIEKPEGLAFLPNGDVLVGSDLPARDAVNLARLRLPE